MNKIIFATAFYLTEKKGVNIKGKGSHDIYFKCMCCFFASLNRFYPIHDKVIFINKELPERFAKILKTYNVITTIIDEQELRFVNTTKLTSNFPGCLYSLDVIKHISQNKDLYKNYDSIFLLDNDVIIADHFDDILESTSKNNYGYKIDVDFQFVMNGKSLSTLSFANSAFFNNHQPLTWYGGELLALNINFIDTFYNESIKYFSFFEENAELFGKGITEEHIYSIIINNFNNEVSNVPNLIKRVWTTFGYNDVDGKEYNYKLLHYPSEKQRLFDSIFRLIENNNQYLEKLSKEQYQEIIYKPIVQQLNPSMSLKIKRKLAGVKKMLKNI